MKFAVFNRAAVGMLACLIVTSSLAFYAAGGLNIAIPAIGAEFSAGLSQLTWVINSFILVLVILILPAGLLADKFGRKRLLGFGLAIYIFALILTFLSPSINFLIAFRFIQGLGVGLMVPQSLAIINVFFETRIRGQAIGLWGAASGAFLVLSPWLSGLIVDNFGWRYIFAWQVPIGLAVFWLVSRLVPDEVLAVKEIRLDVKILQKPAVLGANLYTLFLYTTISALSFYTVIFLVGFWGFSASQAGLALLPLSLAITVLTFFTGKLADRIGARGPMAWGAVLVTLGLLALALADSSPDYFLEIFPGVLLIGLGFGLFIPALTKTALSVPDQFSGMASGVNNAVARLAGFLGVAVSGIILSGVFGLVLENKLGQSNIAAQEILGQKEKILEIRLPQNLSIEDKQEAEKIVADSFLTAYRAQMVVLAVFSFLGAMIALRSIITEKKKI